MNRWRVLTLGSTDLIIHPTMLLYMGYALLCGHGDFTIISMLSILLHESGHALVSYIFGQPPVCIEITPLGAVMKLEDEARLRPIKRTIMLLAGPAVTLTLCCAAYMLAKRRMISPEQARLLFMSNLSILLLNLLPALPLDGGRLLSLLLGQLCSISVVHKVMQGIGGVLGTGMIALNVFASWRLGGWNLSLAFAGCCLLYSAATSTTTYAMQELRHFMDRKIMLERKGFIPTKCCTVLHRVPLRKLIRRLPAGKAAVYICVEAGSMRPMGWLTEAEAIQQYLECPNRCIADALTNGKKLGYEAKIDTI